MCSEHGNSDYTVYSSAGTELQTGPCICFWETLFLAFINNNYFAIWAQLNVDVKFLNALLILLQVQFKLLYLSMHTGQSCACLSVLYILMHLFLSP